MTPDPEAPGEADRDVLLREDLLGMLVFDALIERSRTTPIPDIESEEFDEYVKDVEELYHRFAVQLGLELP